MKIRRRLCHVVLASIACLPLLLVGAAEAQDEPVAVPDAAAPAVPRPARTQPATLSAILDKLDWDAERRGPLIIVVPEFVQPASIRDPNGNKIAPQPPQFSPQGTLSLQQLAPLFNHRILRLRGLTAFVPMEMATIPLEANSQMLERQTREIDVLSGSASLMQLLGSLTEAQWRLVGSETGLGRGDLNTTQVPIFDNLIPASRALQPIQQNPSDSGRGNRFSPPRKIPITPAIRAAIRIRVMRQYQVRLMTMNSERAYPNGNLATIPETPSFALVSAAEPIPDEPQLPPVRNQLKQGQIDLDSNLLDPNISLTGAATVGALLERVRQVTRVEIYPDDRIATYPVYVRGSAAPASEVLKALCWGLGGTFRRLQSGNTTFFLTEDITGVSPRLSRLTSGMIDSMMPSLSVTSGSMNITRTAGYRIFEMKPMPLIGPGRTLIAGPANPVEFVPSTDLTSRLIRPDLAGVADPLKTPRPGRFAMNLQASGSTIVNTDSLPQPIQSLLREQVQKVNQQLDQDPKVRDRPDPNRADISMSIMIQLRHPTMGLLQQTGLPPVGPPPPPPTPEELALPPGNRAVRLTVANPEQARRAVTTARQRGFNQVWIYLPDTLTEEAERETVSAAVAAGSSGSPVAIIPVVPLLGRTPPPQPDGNSDVTSSGISAGEWARERSKSRGLTAIPALQDYVSRQPDWLLPDSAPAAARVARIARLATLPGLAGLAIRFASPPGLFASGANMVARQFDGFLYADVGFSSSFRSDFARRYHVDPIDFATPALGLMLGMEGVGRANAPFLRALQRDASMSMMLNDDGAQPQAGTVQVFQEWIKERQKPNKELLLRLYATVTKAQPNLTLYLPDFVFGSPTPFDENGATSWESWDGADKFPGIATPARPTARNQEAPPTPTRNFARVVARVLSFESHLLQDQMSASESMAAADPPARRLFFSRFIAEETKPLREAKTKPEWSSLAIDLAYQPLDIALDLMTIWPVVSTSPTEATTR